MIYNNGNTEVVESIVNYSAVVIVMLSFGLTPFALSTQIKKIMNYVLINKFNKNLLLAEFWRST